MFFFDILTIEVGTNCFTQNIGMELLPRRQEVSKHVQFLWVLLWGECQILEYWCAMWHYFRNCLVLPYYTFSKVMSHNYPGQGIGPTLPNQHLCCRISFSPNNHHTWDFHLLISHKQNPYTPACCNCLNMRDIHWCMEGSPGLFNVQVPTEHRSHSWFARDKENTSVTLWHSEQVTQPVNMCLATTHVKHRAVWRNGLETWEIVKQAENYLLHEWGFCSVVLIGNVAVYCVCILYIKAFG